MNLKRIFMAFSKHYSIWLIIKPWEPSENHKHFFNLSEPIQNFIYFIPLCHGWPCSKILQDFAKRFNLNLNPEASLRGQQFNFHWSLTFMTTSDWVPIDSGLRHRELEQTEAKLNLPGSTEGFRSKIWDIIIVWYNMTV